MKFSNEEYPVGGTELGNNSVDGFKRRFWVLVWVLEA